MSRQHDDIADQLLLMDAQDRVPGAMGRLVARWKRRYGRTTGGEP